MSAYRYKMYFAKEIVKMSLNSKDLILRAEGRPGIVTFENYEELNSPTLRSRSISPISKRKNSYLPRHMA